MFLHSLIGGIQMSEYETATIKNIPEPKELVRLALKIRENAYVPYSGFHVGAALFADNGKIYTGCNVENASYGAAICAERTAIVKAISDGAKKVLAIAVSSDSNLPTMPCGICRQFLSEFCSPDMPLYLSSRNGEYKVYSFDEILPHSFKQSDMEDVK
ncbi:MAG: cytidine deaminase [Clostridiaceae bacterium]|nr:cytidine deaminase [Clostridiaceae bacterium]